MAEQQDRVVIKFGPARLDSDRAIQRELDALKNDIETKQPNIDLSDYPTTSEVEDIVNEIINEYPPVSGGGGFVIGIPPGVQLAYAPLNLVNYPIDLAAVEPSLRFDATTSTQAPAYYYIGGRIDRDSANVFGHGIDTILTTNGDDFLAISPTAGLVESVAFNPTAGLTYYNGCFSITGGIVSYQDRSTSGAIAPIYVYNGSAVSSFTPAAPLSGALILGIGANYTNDKIAIIWGTSTTITIREYELNGTVFDTHTYTGLTGIDLGGIGASRAKVQNGWVAVSKTPNTFYMFPAVADGQAIKEFTIPNGAGDSGGSFTIYLTSDGYLYSASITDYITYQTDLCRAIYATSSVETFPGAIFNPYDTGERPYFYPISFVGYYTGIIAGLTVISHESIVVTGATKTTDGSGNYFDIPVSLHISITDNPENPSESIVSNAYLTHEDYPVGYNDPSYVAHASTAKEAFKLSDGSIVYVIGNNDGLVGFCIMFNVLASDYVP